MTVGIYFDKVKGTGISPARVQNMLSPKKKYHLYLQFNDVLEPDNEKTAEKGVFF